MLVGKLFSMLLTGRQRVARKEMATISSVDVLCRRTERQRGGKVRDH